MLGIVELEEKIEKLTKVRVKLKDWVIDRARGEEVLWESDDSGGKNRALAENRTGEGELGFSAETWHRTSTDRRLR